MNKSGFLQVDLNRVGYKDEPFILPSQAKQVFYVNDLTSTKWSIVLLSNKVIDEKIEDQGDIGVDIESFTRNDQNENESCIRNDHNEGIWINPTVRVAKRRVEHIPTKKRKRR